MIKVKVIIPNSQNMTRIFLRQTQLSEGVWGECQFYFDEEDREYDWLVVCHSSSLVKPQKILCDPNHLVYLSMEPLECGVPQAFFRQFAKLVLCDRGVVHNDVLYANALTWWVGIRVEHNGGHQFSAIPTFTYDDFKSVNIPSKCNRISVICSNKKLMSGHHKRLDFIAKLQAHPISEHIDFYGGGYRPIPDKWDAIAPYQYHIVLENSVVPDYWSEKLGDAFLGFSIPIYYGCPNIHDYFSQEALHIIDIEEFDETVSILEDLIRQPLSQSQVEAVHCARDKVLNEYNIFQMIANICTEPAQSYHRCSLRPPKYFLEAWINKCRSVILKVGKRLAE